MLMYTIITILLGLCILDYKGKVSYKLLVVLMFFLMAFVTTNADMAAYKMMYNYINGIGDLTITDTGFAFIMFVVKSMKFNFDGFLIIISIIGLTLLTFAIYKYSKCPAIVLALYFVFAFAAETVQIRAFVAEIILYFFLMEIIENKKFDYKKFIIFLVLATLIHSTSIFFALILSAVFIKDKKKLIIIAMIASAFVPVVNTILIHLPISILQNKLDHYVVNEREHISIGAVIYIALYLIITLYIIYCDKRIDNEEWKRKLNTLFRIHIIGMISCVMIIVFSSNFYRITRTIIVVDFIVIGNYFLENKVLNKKNIELLSLGVMLFFLSYEYLTKSWFTIISNNSLLSRFL